MVGSAGIRRRAIILAAAAGAALAVALLAAWSSGPPPNRFAYEGIPARFGFPASAAVLQGYVYAGNDRAVRAHAWSVWAGMTSPTGSRENGRALPVWETWYPVSEVFARNSDLSPASERGRVHRREFVPLRQSEHAGRAFGNEPAAVLSFVKYDRPAALHVRSEGIYLQATLAALKKGFDRARTPVEERAIAPFPSDSVVIKPVFWLVENPGSGKAPGGLTVLPYWDAKYPPPPHGQPPGSSTWAKCVAVDPSGKHVGETRTVDCNGAKGKPRPVKAKVIGLDRFYAVRLSNPADVAAAQAVFRTSPDRLPPGDKDADLGDYMVLVAMHVTTKEMPDWTWETFWWSPTPDAPPFGHDRPASVEGVWRNYDMCASYSMVTPRQPDGRPHACFNPYLETDLGPTSFFRVGTQWFPPDPMAGTQSNCMSCHARAAYPSTSNPRTANYGRIFNEGYLAPDDPYFAHLSRVDFLWSVVDNALAPPKKKKKK